MVTVDIPPVGANVRRLRRARGWSQETLARNAGVTLNSVSRLENGTHSAPSLQSLYAYAQALDVPVSRLLEGER
jgi:transcriptional regulator with XRE-family HTH domain